MKSAKVLAALVCAFCLIAGAVGGLAEGALTVYAPQADAERGGWIKEQAEAALGFEVAFLGGHGGELSERLLAERANPQADVVMGLVQTAMYQLKHEGLFEAYTPAWAEGLPDIYKGPDGYFYSYWQTPIVIVYNPAFVSDPPKSWLDLIDPQYKGKYVVGATSSQTARVYLLGILAQFYDETTGDISDEGWEFVRTLYENAYAEPVDSANQWALMKDGTVPIILSWYGGIKAKAIANEVAVEYVYPEIGTPVVAEGVAIVKGTEQLEQAQAFIDWWGSAETMAAYAAQFNQAPAHPDAIALCPAEMVADAEKFIAQPLDWETFSKKLDDWIVKIELEIIP